MRYGHLSCRGCQDTGVVYISGVSQLENNVLSFSFLFLSGGVGGVHDFIFLFLLYDIWGAGRVRRMGLDGDASSIDYFMLYFCSPFFLALFPSRL